MSKYFVNLSFSGCESNNNNELKKIKPSLHQVIIITANPKNQKRFPKLHH